MVEYWNNTVLTEWLNVDITWRWQNGWQGILGRPLDCVGKWHHHLGRKPQMPKLLNLTQSLPRRRGRDRQSQRHSHAELDETLEDNLKDTLRENWTHASMSLALGSRLGRWKLFPSQMCRRLLLPLFLWMLNGRQKNFQGNGIGNSGRWSMRTGRRGRVIAILSEGREGQKSENGAGVRVCVGDVWLEAATSFPTFGLVNIIHISQIEIVTEVTRSKTKWLVSYQIL